MLFARTSSYFGVGVVLFAKTSGSMCWQGLSGSFRLWLLILFKRLEAKHACTHGRGSLLLAEEQEEQRPLECLGFAF